MLDCGSQTLGERVLEESHRAYVELRHLFSAEQSAVKELQNLLAKTYGRRLF